MVGERSRLSRLGICAASMLLAVVGFGQTHDVLDVAGQTYIRSNQLVSGDPYAELLGFSVAPDGTSAAVVVQTGVFQDTEAYIRHVDSWGRSLHAARAIDPKHAAGYVVGSVTRHVPGRSYLFWVEWGTGDYWLGLYDLDGAAVRAPILITDHVTADGEWGLAVGPDEVAFGVRGLWDDASVPQLLIWRYDLVF